MTFELPSQELQGPSSAARRRRLLELLDRFLEERIVNISDALEFFGINIEEEIRGIRTEADCRKVELRIRNQAKQLYRELAKLTHPDAGGNQEDFVRLQGAYELLSRITIEPKRPQPRPVTVTVFRGTSFTGSYTWSTGWTWGGPSSATDS
jgi:hypothetical protein